MILRDLSLQELEVLHKTELHEAFPPEELKPFAAMRTLYNNGVYTPWGPSTAMGPSWATPCCGTPRGQATS